MTDWSKLCNCRTLDQGRSAGPWCQAEINEGGVGIKTAKHFPSSLPGIPTGACALKWSELNCCDCVIRLAAPGTQSWSLQQLRTGQRHNQRPPSPRVPGGSLTFPSAAKLSTCSNSPPSLPKNASLLDVVYSCL